MTILELLCKIEYTQGGTIHQYAKEYNCKVSELMLISEDKINYIDNVFTSGKDANKWINVARSYYKKQLISIQDIVKMLVKYETIRS